MYVLYIFFPTVDDHDDDDVGQAYQLGMMMGAEINV